MAPPGLSVSSTLFYFAGKAGGSLPPQFLTISSAGAPVAFTVAATTASGGSWLGAGTSGTTTPTSISVDVNNSPTALSAGTYKGTLTITPTSPGYSPVTVAVTLVLTATVAPTPTITVVQNGASNLQDSGVVSDSYLTIKGTNLASTTDTWNNSIVGGQLPTVLDGVTVTFSGMPAYISYISPTQINVLVPSIALGTASIQVNNNGASSSSVTVGSAQYDPAFFLFTGSTQVIATRADYSYAAKNGTIPGLATVPAKPGDVLILWGTGFGVTSPITLPGVVTPGDKAYSTSTPVTVTINNVTATVYGAALTPGDAGLYQVAIQVPPSLANGDWPIVATVGSATFLDLTSSPSGAILTVHN